MIDYVILEEDGNAMCAELLKHKTYICLFLSFLDFDKMMLVEIFPGEDKHWIISTLSLLLKTWQYKDSRSQGISSQKVAEISFMQFATTLLC